SPTILRAEIEFSEPRISYFDGIDLENKCMSRLERRIEGKNGILVSHSHYDIALYNGSRNCFIMLAAPIGYRIRLRIIKFDVNGQMSDCEKDTLHVFDHETPIDPNQPHRPTDEAVIPGPLLGQFCGKITNTSELVVSRLNAMTLWWHTDPELPKQHGGVGFKILWSAFRKEMSAPCAPGHEFACGNKECIPASLACNSYGDCSDDADLVPTRQLQNKCERIFTHPPSSSSLPLVFIVSAIVVCLCLLCICLCIFAPRHAATVQQPKFPDQDSRKEYTPATEDTVSSRDGNKYCPPPRQPQPPTFYPPSPPLRSTRRSEERGWNQTTTQRGGFATNPRGVRRLHHSAHTAVQRLDAPPSSSGGPPSQQHHYYHKFIRGAYGAPAPSSDYGTGLSGCIAPPYPDPPPTICDSDYTYVRPVMDSHIV
ncbi:hypothetical protein PENTCL1PPCAC_29934, partial [Pristionchus entomophagus]